MIFLYNFLMILLILLGAPIIIPVVLFRKKRRKTVLKRLGLFLPDEIRGEQGHKPIWVHALSVGEVLSAVPLVFALKKRFPERRILFSASTQTGFKIARERLGNIADALFFFPLDVIFSVRRTAVHVNPAFVVIVETDIWPNFLYHMAAKEIPVILVNARLSLKSFKGYKKLGFFTSPVFSKFTKVCAQAEEDASRFKLLGTDKDNTPVTGNIKFDQEDDNDQIDYEAHFREVLGISPHRKIIVAGSTHNGEEEIILEAYAKLKEDITLIIVPRDPDRAGAVRKLAQSHGFSANRYSRMKGPDTPQIIVVDVMGILKGLYSLCHVAFVGGSLVNFGGHNPLEPAFHGKPVIFGPHMSDFKEISRLLIKGEGAVQVKDADDLGRELESFFSNPSRAEEMGKAAVQVYNANKGALGRTLEHIEKTFRERRA